METTQDQQRVLEAKIAQLETQLQHERRARATLRRRLTRRQAYIRHITRTIPATLTIYTPLDKTSLFLNHHLYEELGYSPDEIRQSRPRELQALLHPYDKLRLPMHYEKVQNAPDGSFVQMDLRLRGKNGRWKWIRVHDTVFTRAASGKAEQLMGWAYDISEEKDSTEKLTQQKEFYENILNNIPAGITVFSADHVYLFANGRDVAPTDPAEDLGEVGGLAGTGYPGHSYVRPADAGLTARQHQKFLQALASRQEVTWEETLELPNHDPSHTLRKFHPVVDEYDQVAYVIGYGVDITRRKQMEQQLANQQEFVRQVIEANPNPIYVRDDSGRFILANDAYARLHELPVAQLLGQAGLASDQSRDQDLALLRSGTTVSFEEVHEHADERRAWYHTIKKPFVRPDGTRYLLTISSDITDLNRARLTAEESVRAKEAFLANMSHEIRTPMNGILGLARLLKKSASSPEQDEYLDIILSNAESLLVILNDILDFAKIESGQVELERIPFDVAAAVQSTTKSLAFSAQAKGLALRTQLPATPLPVVEGDPVRLTQVLVNLINNAIKFTSTGSITVTVALEPTPDPAGGAGTVQLRFCVEDTGIGISPDKHDQVFRSFGQATSSTTRLYGGTGLGLAICKNLLALQHGRIWLESQPGQGSRFYFSLPYHLSDQMPVAREEARVLPPNLLRGLRVLLVEDNLVNTLLARALLDSWHVQTAVAGDGEQALALAAAAPYDLILMDIQMPRLNGVEATSRLRAEPGPNRATPIIALTANAMKTEVESYAQVGFTDWLLKPYHENSLYLMLARHTGREQLLPEPEPEPAPAPAPPVYGFAGLGKLAHDAAFVRKMQQLFLDTVPAQLSRLEADIREQHWEAALHTAHSLKAAYGNLQIEEALRSTKKIEEILKKNPEPQSLSKLLRTTRHITDQMAALFSAALQA